MSTSALASLTATYTDSEGEEEDNNEDVEKALRKKTTNPLQGSNSDQKSSTSSRPSSPSIVSTVFVKTKLAKLVSYHDDTIASDEEPEADDDIPQQIIFVNDEEKTQEAEMVELDGVVIPPEPPGSCSAELQDKITKLYEKMQTQQMDMNSLIQKRKDFRNPSIYEKLIQYCGLNELGTNYPPNLYDPLKFGKESYYEELAKIQKAEMDKREKERKGKVKFVSGTKKLEEEANKRKSKWDMPGGASMKVNQPGLVAPPTLTTTATGTKSNVIPAFGSLPKKPKI
ncbi:SAP30-binding protein-like [Sitophilus oryzae]|uniref:SAP30-binding protein-like n=1 Tax=Sitophilus oryzae TaxID=7048 RepID=A0A6J2Y689_SITOR|nr:SAP30-binding protein-like [Sitophilus oryzae]